MSTTLALCFLLNACTAGGLLTNADFAADGGWTVPTGWTIVDDDGHSESHSLVYEQKLPGKGEAVVQTIACRPNTDYVLGAWVKTDGRLTPLFEVRAPELKDTQALRASVSVRPNLWTAVNQRFNSGAATKLVVKLWASDLHYSGKGSPIGRIAYDDVNLWAAADVPQTVEVAGGVMAAAPGENLALGQPYTLSPAPNYSYCTDPADKSQLTDGAYSVGYFWVQKTTVGWSRGNPVIVKVDLGQKQPICGVSFNTAAGVAGVAWPVAVFLYVSDDGQAWYDADELTGLSAAHGLPGDGYQVHRYWTDQLKCAARYVAFVISPGSQFTFVDEVEVYQGPDSLANWQAPGEPVTDLSAAALERRTSTVLGNRVTNTIEAVRKEVKAAQLDAGLRQQLLARLDQAAQRPAPSYGPKDRLIAPFGEAHREALAVRGQLRVALGQPASQAWKVSPWDPLDYDADVPAQADLAKLDIRLMHDEVRSDAFCLTVNDPKLSKLEIAVQGPDGLYRPKDGLTLREVAWTATAAGDPTASALPAAATTDNAWQIEVPAGTTRQIWVDYDSSRAQPGPKLSEESLVVTAGGQRLATIPMTIRVSSLSMPDKLSLSLGGWSYTDGAMYGVTAANRDAVVKFLQEYHLDSPWATSAAMPFGKHDKDGIMTEPPDTQRMDDWLARWPDAKYYCIFNSFGQPLAETPAAKRKIAEWITFWCEHLASLGIEPEQLCLLLVDEPHAAEQDEQIIGYAKAIKAAQPRVNIWEDPTWRDPRQANPELLSVSDILCPNRPMWYANEQVFKDVYLAQQKAGRKLTFYSCSGPVRDLDPYSYHRLQAWDCYRYDMFAMYYWAFGDSGGGSAWNELAARGRCFSPQFIDDEGCVTAKHMEAIRQGLYDHEYLTMLEAAVEAAVKADRDDAVVKQAQALLTDGVNRVLGAEGVTQIGWRDKKDRSLADEVRLQVLDALEALAK